MLPETPLVNIFFDDFWGTPLTHSGSHKSYRPLCVLSFRFNYALGKLNPWGYHLGNVLLHAMVTAVFTCLAQKVLKRKFATYVAGLLFAAHPIHTEAVAGIVGRADIGACLFFLLTFLSYMKYVEYRTSAHMASHRWLYVVSVCVFTVASLLTKEQAIAVLGVCATYDVFVFHRVKLQEILQLHIFTMVSTYFHVSKNLPIFWKDDLPVQSSKATRLSHFCIFLSELKTFQFEHANTLLLLTCPYVEVQALLPFLVNV